MSSHAQECFYTNVYTSCVLLLVWPLYIYFIKHWYSHRNHFVIRNRWPIITMVIIICTLIMQIIIWVEAALCIYTLVHIPIGMSNVVTGLVYYRTYLLYAETIKTRRYLRKMEQSKTMIIENENTDYHRNISRFILFIVCITSLSIPVSRYLMREPSIPTIIAFTITLLIGIFCVINIIRNKVTDAIGITKECVIQITINFIMLIVTRVSDNFPTSYINVNNWLGFVAGICYGLCSLIIVYNRTKSTPIEAPQRQLSVAEEHQLSGLNLPKHNTQTSGSHLSPSHETALPPLRDPNSLSKWLQKPLVHFLTDNTRNLDLFIGYLSECFALENMLFLERAIILYHIIKKCEKEENERKVKPQNMDNKSDVFVYSCYKLKFVFLSQIYADIETMIENGCKQNDENEDLKYKQGIVAAMKCIYRQFCCPESVHEINVAYDVQNKLRQLFENKTNDDIFKQFDNYHDLLSVYHEAIVECWNLCVAIYGFQFKAYLRKHIIKDTHKTESNQKTIDLSLVKHDSALNPKMKKVADPNTDDIHVDIIGNVEN